MRSLLDRAKAGIRAFWEQRDDLVLLLGAADIDLPAVLKIVEGLDAELAFAWCWVFAQPFTAPDAYADAIIGDIATKRDAVSATLVQSGKPAWPVLPNILTDPAVEPADRIRAAVVYVRDLVPVVPGGITVFALLPTENQQSERYAALCQTVVRHDMPFPWCARVRFMLRDDPAAPLTATRSMPHVRTLRTDFSSAALGGALEQEIADPDVPDAQKMMSAIIAAGIHEAQGRHAEAHVLYLGAMDHFGRQGNATVAALAAHGVAACKQALGDLAAAERIWLAALETGLAAEPPALPVLLNISLGLVVLVARQGRWFEAEAYAVIAHLIAKVLFMPTVQAEAEERCGIAQSRQGKTDAAERSWRAAIRTADDAGDTNRAMSARTWLRNLLKRREGHQDEVRTLGREIAALKHRLDQPHAVVGRA